MPIKMLNNQYIFPPLDFAEEDGILAIGGDLAQERLLLAYQSGIFPWYSTNSPILWWSPDPRFVLFLDEFHCSKSLKKVLNKKIFTITADESFSEVIRNCSLPRGYEKGTWITKEIKKAYLCLHESGYAHSIEARLEGKLVGGLYGVCLGRIFFGESMFTFCDNASKAALAKLVDFLRQRDFQLIDSQVYTDNMARFGAKEISRKEFIKILNDALKYPNLKGSWSQYFSAHSG
jgi:leucyl/phenylalanyl-tRNA--protein transferase